ncbi:MAG: HD-GYP domain-containing protein [Chloroflexota bacterium]
MEAFAAVWAAFLSAAFAVYGVIKHPASGGMRTYLQMAVVLLVATVVVAALRVADLMPAASLLGASLLGFVLLAMGGFLYTLYAQVEEARQTRLLRTAASLLIPTSDLEVLLDQVLDIAHAAVKVDGSSIMLLDPETRQLRFAATRGIDRRLTREYRISLDHPAISELWPGQGPLIIRDVEKVPAFRAILVRSAIRSFFGIPLVTRDTLVGFLNVHRTRVSNLRPEEIALLSVLASQAAVAINQSRLNADLRHRYLDTVSVLASAMEVNDPYTLGHSRRVAAISRLVAEELGLSRSTREAVEVAALLHDIGKLGVSNQTLRKLGQLSPEERVEVRTHASLGALVLREADTLRDILPAVLHHHERWDGTGYPKGLAGEAIPLIARVIGAADAYEVMMAGRSYREARRPAAAIAEMKREAGRQFDPNVVNALVRLYERGALPGPDEMRLDPQSDDDAAAS